MYLKNKLCCSLPHANIFMKMKGLRGTIFFCMASHVLGRNRKYKRGKSTFHAHPFCIQISFDDMEQFA